MTDSSPMPPSAMDNGETVSDIVVSTNAAIWTLFALSTAVVGLRIVSKHFVTKAKLGWDDVCIVTGWAVLLASTVLLTITVSIGQSYSLDELPRLNLISICAGAFSILAVIVPKVAFGIVIVRLLNMSGNKRQAWATMAPSIFMLLYGIPGIIAQFVQCSPPAARWNPMAYPNAECLQPIHLTNYAISAGVFSTVVDLIYAILPAIIVFRLQLKLRNKIVVSILMGFGIVAAAFSIYKTVILAGITPALESKSITALLLISIRTALWTIIEANVLQFCACVPMLVPLFKLFRQKGESLLSSYRTRKSSSSRSLNSTDLGSGSREKSQSHSREVEDLSQV